MKRLSLTALLAMTAPAIAAPVDVTDAWFRSLPGKLPAGGYFTAQNNTSRDVAITGCCRKDSVACTGRAATAGLRKSGMPASKTGPLMPIAIRKAPA